MSKTPNAHANLIDGEWMPGDGSSFESSEPGNGQVVWAGNGASESQVGVSIAAARKAFPDWQLRSLENRIEIVRKYQAIVKEKAAELSELISQEVGKPRWEAKTEAGAVAGKVQLAIDAILERRWTQQTEMDGYQAVMRYQPHGVLGVLGPFNFPAHLPNGHIIPALLAGNTLVFKPSEHAPAVGEWMVRQWIEAGLPNGVLNLVQGGLSTGIALSHHPGLDGILFTGSSRAGVSLHENFGGQPQKILALEMGGNNPLIVHQSKDLKAAAYTTVLSAYLTAGQRCTCARRLIMVEGNDCEQFVEEFRQIVAGVKVGLYSDEPEPFMGTVISEATGNRLLAEQEKLLDSGATPLIKMERQRECDALLSPGFVDVTGIEAEDEELFGPFLTLRKVESFEAAVEEANRTRYGLSAGLISDDASCYEYFIQRIRAGVVNWNRQTTGASGKLPFGGCGLSGNHRPSGYYAADYCSFPVASLESESLELPEKPMTGIRLGP